MTHYFKDDEKDVVNNGNGEQQEQRNMYPNSGINAAAAVAASRHAVSLTYLPFLLLLFSFRSSVSTYRMLQGLAQTYEYTNKSGPNLYNSL